MTQAANETSQPVDRIQDRTDVLRTVWELGRLVDRPFGVIDPQAHTGMPSRRLASLVGTIIVWSEASRAFHTSAAAVSSASSRSSGVTACCRARRQ
jgi:hypothetical protein